MLSEFARHKAVAESRFRDDAGGVWADFFAYAGNVDVDGACGDGIFVGPCHAVYLVACEEFAGVFHEQFQDLIFCP